MCNNLFGGSSCTWVLILALIFILGQNGDDRSGDCGCNSCGGSIGSGRDCGCGSNSCTRCGCDY